MERSTKIILTIISIFLIIFVFVGIYLGLTLKKGLDLKKSIEEIDMEQIEEDIEDIKAGDCSKLEELENNAKELKAEIIEACKNPALKKIIEKQSPGACDIANNPNSDAQKELDSLREQCNLA